MKHFRNDPLMDHDQLVNLVRYEDGFLYWRNPRGNQKRTALGWDDKSSCRTYRRMTYKKRAVYVHRLIWFYHYGTWPDHQLDHIDNNSLNNQIENLQQLTAKDHAAKTRAS